jgi:hypothetical protein
MRTKTITVTNPPKVGDILVKRYSDDSDQVVVYGVIETHVDDTLLPYCWVWQLHLDSAGNVHSFYPRTSLFFSEDSSEDTLMLQRDDARVSQTVSWVEDETTIDAGKDKADDWPPF